MCGGSSVVSSVQLLFDFNGLGKAFLALTIEYADDNDDDVISVCYILVCLLIQHSDSCFFYVSI